MNTADLGRAVAGLGPHGEAAAPIEQLEISSKCAARASERAFAVVAVMHTTGSDWARQQLAGVAATLARYGARLVDVVDSDFRPERQIAALEDLLVKRPDAVIAIPVDNVATAGAFARLGPAGIPLVLMDNAPAGLLPRKHYASVVSADNFGNGQVAATMLAMYVPDGGEVVIVGYGRDFFSINEREIGFRKLLGDARPDVRLSRVEFTDIDQAGRLLGQSIATGRAPDGIFVVWDDPAMSVVRELRAAGLNIPMTTIDLGNEVAFEIARGGLVVGVGAQRPYDQGVAEALAALMALCGEEPPPWVALPGLAVTRRNVIDAYQRVWHEAAPTELREFARGKGPYWP
jgi:ribose transport system substrate-binding protein